MVIWSFQVNYFLTIQRENWMAFETLEGNLFVTVHNVTVYNWIKYNISLIPLRQE